MAKKMAISSVVLLFLNLGKKYTLLKVKNMKNENLMNQAKKFR